MTLGTKNLRPTDNKDDRREVYADLARLSPLRRVEWLSRACRLALLPRTRTSPHVSPKTVARAKAAMSDDSLDAGLTTEIFFDFWTMAANYNLDVPKALDLLVTMVRGK